MDGIRVYDSTGKEQGPLSLDLSITQRDICPKAYANAVRVILQNGRQGTVGVKGRSDVSRTNKKPWRQKGTGRARAGSARSPLWKGGGVTFGPQPRTRTLKLPQKQRSLVLNNVLFEALKEKKIQCLDFGSELQKPSTKAAQSVLAGMGLDGKRILLFLGHDDVLNISSFRNLPNVRLVGFDEPNAFALTNGEKWLFLKKDVELFKMMVSKWN